MYYRFNIRPELVNSPGPIRVEPNAQIVSNQLQTVVAEFVPGPSHPDAGFTLRAPYPLWREILGGKTLAATAILMGRMKVEGNTVALLKHAGAHRSLMHCVSSLDTRYP